MRRRSLPKPDPGHVAKRKAFLAEQYVFNGNHASIKKTITWDDLSDPKKNRLSTSETPGLSDKSYTPTPAARPLPSALKSSNSARNGLTGSQARPRLLPPKKEVVVLPPDAQPSTPGPSAKLAPRLPKKSTPAPRRINLDADSVANDAHQPDRTETTPANARPEPIIIEDEESAEDGPPVPTADPAEDVAPTPPRPLFNPDSDDDRDANPDNEWLTRPSPAPRASSPLSSPDLGAAVPLSPAMDDSGPGLRSPPAPRSTGNGTAQTPIVIPSTSSNTHVSAIPTPNTPSPPPRASQLRRQKRRRSSVGIQTVPEREVDWLDGVDINESMSAIDVSRVWARGGSPTRSQAGKICAGGVDPEDEDEPMGASFLEEFEGPRPKAGPSGEQAQRAESVGPFSDADEGVGKAVMTEDDPADEVPNPESEPAQGERPRHGSSSPEPIPAPEQSQSARSSPDPISFDHYAGMTEDAAPESTEGLAAPTSSKTQREVVAARVAALQTSASQPVNPKAGPYPFNLQTEATPKRTSASQPARSRSRMYTPMPLPGQPLRAAPTLGRSLYDEFGVETGQAESSKAAENRNALRAAPTLGRSMDWTTPGETQDTKATQSTETPKVALVDAAEEENPFHESGRPQMMPSPSPPPQSKPNSGKSPAPAPAKPRRISESQPDPPMSRPRLSFDGQAIPSASQPQAVSSPLSPVPAEYFEDNKSHGSPTHVGSDVAEGDIPNVSNEEHDDYEAEEDQNPPPVRENTSEPAPVDSPAPKSRSPSVKSRVESANVAGTDYDAEYGSIPDVLSVVPDPKSRSPSHISISSSPAHAGAWNLEPSQSSTPRYQAKLPPSAVPVLHIDSPPRPRKAPEIRRPGLKPSPNRPKSLAALGKRRRESVTPQPPAKKIRREYNTVESGAMPRDTRAHEDKFDEAGNRIWVPHRPTMQRAPESSRLKATGQPIQKRVVSEAGGSEVDDNNAGPEEAPREIGADVEMEHAVEVQETEPRPEPLEDAFTEIPETPQLAPVRNFEALLEPSIPIAGPSRTLLVDAPVLAIEPPTPVAYQPAPPASVAPSVDRSRASPFISFASRRSRTSRSKRKSEASGLQFTPGPRNSRTRLSLGGKSGPIIEEASERDARILQEAGLKPTLKRLSQAHGFTPEVVADVYQEHGDLKETEEALKEMKRSASRTRARIARRTSMRDSMASANVFSSQGQGEGSSSSDDEQVGNVLSGLDGTRTTGDILFGGRR
ncbi:hypothetical protein RhiJN_24576 [Ceratobasidium sp. AG-Ba]|nr:hypothetical protein RhiJN_24576 [Ceratobasidium sp. AG-Ba]